MKTENERITVAENAGFCFGVRRAAEMISKEISSAGSSGERIYTLGKLIHNSAYISELEAAGVRVTDAGSLEALASGASAESPVKVFVRAHGMTLDTEKLL
ncbi:MAG: hypothetical protein J5592_09210, partial [Clostridia bacterium]|nr:hypothetical protein [Clostridia bacterium]